MGGKCRHIKYLNAILPQSTTTFVDVFGGAGWVITGATIQANMRVYNDYSPYMSSIHWHISNQPLRFREALCQLIKSEDHYYRYRDSIFANPHDPKDIDVAAKWLYMLAYSFTGNTLNAKSKPYFDRNIDKLDSIKKKLLKHNQKNVVENLDFEAVIRKYDAPDSVFYCDPPYWRREHYYQQEFDDHHRLAQVLNSIQGKAAVSYYEFPELAEWYSGWQRHTYEIYKPSSYWGSRKRATELVLTNY